MTVEAISGGNGVEGAIQRAAAQTGVNFGFLLQTARRESGLNPKAHASTSSAAGLFQFVEQTWLSAVKRFGPRHGLGAYAAQVEEGPDGKFHVANPAMRKQVLDLRLDPQASALMAGELTQDHAAYLQGRTGRAPSAGELYAAHVLGPAGSARLTESVASRPATSAAQLFPEAAAANAGLFYRNGRPVSVAELSATLTHAAAGVRGCDAAANRGRVRRVWTGDGRSTDPGAGRPARPRAPRRAPGLGPGRQGRPGPGLAARRPAVQRLCGASEELIRYGYGHHLEPDGFRSNRSKP